MATLRKQVGDLVRHHRKQAGFTQDQLASETQRSLEMINRIERGVVAPSFETLEAFAKALRVDVRDLFGSGEFAAKGSRDDGLVKLLNKVAGLDQEDMDWVNQLVTVALRRKVRTSTNLR